MHGKVPVFDCFFVAFQGVLAVYAHGSPTPLIGSLPCGGPPSTRGDLQDKPVKTIVFFSQNGFVIQQMQMLCK